VAVVAAAAAGVAKREGMTMSITKLRIVVLLSLLALPLGVAHAAGQKVFASAEDAAKALVAAARVGDRAALEAIFGPDSHDLFFSGDDVADLRGLARFAEWADESTELTERTNGSIEMSVGEEEWPLPMPLVKSGEGWVFDTPAGKDELINRRIGANELSAIDISRGYVDAQLRYASRDRDGDGVNEFAQKVLSDDGKQDGLFWNASKHGGEQSPIGPFAASATSEGYKAKAGKPMPYHGYYFRILKKQGKHAPGGKRDYVVDGNMTKGFAVVAYPAEYGVSGIMTFLINRNGILFQKDLGEKTEKLAAAIDSYDPDYTWMVVKE
jgi:hypothetical protein